MKSTVLILGTMVCVALCASTGQAKTTKTVQVDCTKGDSIAEALEEKADELIIEISGFCYENVDVRRSDVTLRGTDAALDGILGPSPESDTSRLIDIRSASRITLSNLTLANSNWYGLFVRDGQDIRVEDCVFRDNLGDGVAFSDASGAVITNSLVEHNGRYGLQVLGASKVMAIDSDFLDNANFAVWSVEEGTVHVRGSDCSVEGPAGLGAVQDGFILVTGCSVIVPGGIALHAFEQGDLNVYNISFVGALWAEWKSLVWLAAIQDDAGPEGNFFAEDSTLLMHGGHLAGTTTFDSFSNGSIKGGDFEILLCRDGGDVACGGSTPAGNAGSTGCGFCP